MGAYEDARNASEFPKRKPVFGDESHLTSLYNAIGEMQVPVSDTKAYGLATQAGDAISSAVFQHRAGNSTAASLKSFEASHHISTLANHLMNNHGTTDARAKYAGDIPRDIAADYVDSVVQHEDDNFRNGGNN